MTLEANVNGLFPLVLFPFHTHTDCKWCEDDIDDTESLI